MKKEGFLMHIIRNKSTTGNLNTELYNILNNISNVPLYNNEHELRHPLGIYNLSSRRVFDAFEELICQFNNSSSNPKDLSEAHSELLDSLMAFIDDGYLIMKALYPISSVSKDIRFADRWLTKVDKTTKKIIEDYQNSLFPYRKRLADIVNRVKHNHARYCHIEANTIYGPIRGYYIEGITKDGVIIPNREIHPDVDGFHTAISYNKDIKNYLVNFYIISGLMTHTIKKLIRHLHDIKIKSIPCESKDDEKIMKICENVAAIKDLFFYDEYDTMIPQIITQTKTEILEFRKPAYKSFIKKLLRPPGRKFRAVMTTDGVSNSWALPYYRND